MSRLGVAIPTYNREDQLESLLRTIPEDIPVYISDNGAYLTENFRTKFPRTHISAVAGNVLPPLENWNRAALMVREEWLIIPSDDDIYYDKSFETILEYINKYPNADVIVFGHNTVDENYRITGQWVPKSLMELASPAGFEQVKYGVDARMPSIVFRRTLLEQIGFFDEEFKITASDSYMVQRATLVGHSVFVPSIVSGYRVWPKGSTQSLIFTSEWMCEIAQWGNKLETQLSNIPKYTAESRVIRAEIYARNLHAGVSRLRRKGLYRQAVRHFLSVDYPWRATLHTQLRIIYQLLRLPY